MCTVTIVPNANAAQGFRMACNRDEQRGRPLAQPPQQRIIQGIQTLMPIDPASGGTWVGVNEQGLALTLLNYNLVNPPTDRDQSRGQVIPHLLHASSIDQVIELASAIRADRTMPFRLVACDDESLLLWRSTEPIEQADVQLWDRKPVMYTSSGLGDHLVEAPRRELFNQWFGDEPSAWPDKQASLHRHHWPGREHLSICMSREDARTVSYTIIEVASASVTMTYHPDRPDRAASTTAHTLTRRPATR